MAKILIVDDNAPFRQSLKEILDDEFPWVAVEEAVDIKEAMQKIEDLLPELVFMDIRLPDGTGLALTRKIKATYPDIIIIILTNYDIPEYLEAAKQYGANYFFAKGPSNRKQITELVNVLLSDMNHSLCD